MEGRIGAGPERLSLWTEREQAAILGRGGRSEKAEGRRSAVRGQES